MSLTKTDLIKMADEAYPDNLVIQNYDQKKGKPKDAHADTLALFIVRELHETFDEGAPDEKKLYEAFRVLRRACHELAAVRNTFRDALLRVNPNALDNDAGSF